MRWASVEPEPVLVPVLPVPGLVVVVVVVVLPVPGLVVVAVVLALLFRAPERLTRQGPRGPWATWIRVALGLVLLWPV